MIYSIDIPYYSFSKDIEEMDVNLLRNRNADNVELAVQISENVEDNEMVPLPVQEFTSLLQKLKQAENRAKETEEELQQALHDLQQIRYIFSCDVFELLTFSNPFLGI